MSLLSTYAALSHLTHSIARIFSLVNPYRALLRWIGGGVAQRNNGADDQALLSPGPELDVMDSDAVDGEVEAVGEDLGNNEKGRPARGRPFRYRSSDESPTLVSSSVGPVLSGVEGWRIPPGPRGRCP